MLRTRALLSSRIGIATMVVVGLMSLLLACSSGAPTPSASPKSPAGSAAAKPAGTPIKVGFLAPLSGPTQTYGQLLKFAPRLAADDVNSAGGVNGSPLEIITEDTTGDPKQAVIMLRKMVEQDKVVAIIGPYFSGEFEVAAPLAKELSVPIITSTATKPAIQAGGRPWSFRLALIDDNTVAAAVDGFKKNYPNVKTMAIAGDVRQAMSQYVVQNLWPKLLKDKGYEVVDTVTFTTGTSDFSPIATRLKGAKPDGLAWSAFAAEATGMLKEMDRQGVKIPKVTSPHVHTVPPFPVIAGDVAEGLVMATYIDLTKDDPQWKQFVSRYKALAEADSNIPKPVFIGMASEPPTYDAIMLVAKTLQDAKINAGTSVEQARTALRDGLQKTKDYKGMTSTVSADADGNLELKPIPIIVEKGQWKPIK